MSSYTVSVSSGDPAGPAVTASVRLDAGGPIVEQLTVRPGTAGTELPSALGAIDFAELLRVAAMMSSGRLLTSGAGEAPPDPPPAVDPPAVPAPAPAQRAGRRSGASRQPDDPVAGPAAGAALPSDLAVVYWRLGSAAKVAAHYDVPRQIATDWIKALRRQGAAPDPWKRAQKPGTGRH